MRGIVGAVVIGLMSTGVSASTTEFGSVASRASFSLGEVRASGYAYTTGREQGGTVDDQSCADIDPEIASAIQEALRTPGALRGKTIRARSFVYGRNPEPNDPCAVAPLSTPPRPDVTRAVKAWLAETPVIVLGDVYGDVFVYDDAK